jgi:hypothetical protein
LDGSAVFTTLASTGSYGLFVFTGGAYALADAAICSVWAPESWPAARARAAAELATGANIMRGLLQLAARTPHVEEELLIIVFSAGRWTSPWPWRRAQTVSTARGVHARLWPRGSGEARSIRALWVAHGWGPFGGHRA